MATRTLAGSIPPIVLVPGMIAKLEAIDPTTGAAVSTVIGRTWTLYGDAPEGTATAGGDSAPAGPFMLVPGPDSAGG